MKEVVIHKKPDLVLFLLYLIIVTLGWLNLYATNYTGVQFDIFDYSVGKQLVWIIFSLVVGILILFVEPLFFSSFAYLIYGAVLILLLGVLFYGTVTHGARAWFEIGGIRFQPAEFGKLATALALSKFLSSTKVKWTFSDFNNLIIIIGIIVLPAGLILLQPDLGSAIVFSAFIFPLYREGMPGLILILILMLIFVSVFGLIFKLTWLFLVYLLLAMIFLFFIVKNKKIFYYSVLAYFSIFVFLYILTIAFKITPQISLLLFISLLVVSPFFLYVSFRKNIKKTLLVLLFLSSAMFFSYVSEFFYSEIFKPHQRTRIDVFLGKIDDPKGVGYNLRQAKIAISSGGAFGKGFLKGTITKYEFVPEEDTDFIFCTIGEEWGFVGATIVFLLFFLLIARIIYIAERQIAVFSRVYAYSLAAILFFHVAINIGMTVGLFPVIGIPLPFFSYGGSAMLGFSVFLFILLNLDTKREFLL